jgi:hypothetical protein
MLTQPVQSTVFIVDVVDLGTHPWPFSHILPIDNGTHRIRARERYSIIVPDGWEDDIDDTCGDSVLVSELPIHLARVVTWEVELEYELIGTGNIDIIHDSIHFHEAGLRIMTRACGPAYALEERCKLRSRLVISAVNNYLNAIESQNDVERHKEDNVFESENVDDLTYWQNFLGAVWDEDCFGELFPNAVRAVDDVRRRVYYFHADAHLIKPATGAATGVALGTDIFQGAFPLQASSTLVDPNHLADYNLYPLIWYPFENEAFAFAAAISADRFKLLGRMGGLTRGYRITDDLHWQANIDEERPLTFAEDIVPGAMIEKYAEFDAGALPPGDFDIGLDPTEVIHLWLQPVPFYIGAMPLGDPVAIENRHLSTLHDTHGFAFLEGEIDTPIIFDPVVNCGSCPSLAIKRGRTPGFRRMS